MRRTAFALVMMISFVSVVNGFWWDSPETKAKKLVLKIENYAAQCNTYEDLMNLGWDKDFTELSKRIIAFGEASINPLLMTLENKNRKWQHRFLCAKLVISVEAIKRQEAAEIANSFTTIIKDNSDHKEVRKAIADNFYWMGGQSSEIKGNELATAHWASLFDKRDREKIVETLVAVSGNPLEDREVRWTSIRALSVFPDFATLIIDSLSSCLSDEYQELRAISVSTLGALAMTAETERISKILLQIFSEATKDLATERALFWLAKLQISEAIPLLIRSLKNGEYCSPAAAADALGELKAIDAVPLLCNALTDKKDRYFAMIAAKSLGQIGDRKAVEPLINSIHRGGGIAIESARSLGEIGDKRAIPPLMEELSSATAGPEFQRSVAAALIHLGAINAIPLIEEKIREGDNEVEGSWDGIEEMLKGIEYSPEKNK